MSSSVKVAAVHAAPVFLDSAATTAKAISIIREAAKAGASLIAFPETYIPAFPVWAALWPGSSNHRSDGSCTVMRHIGVGGYWLPARALGRAAGMTTADHCSMMAMGIRDTVAHKSGTRLPS